MVHKIFLALVQLFTVALKQALEEISLCPAERTGKCPLGLDEESADGDC